MRYYTDGSSTIGVKSAHCVTDESGQILIYNETPQYLTNNEEEYRAVIAALKICQDGDEILTDSLLVVNQISGKYKITKPHLKKLCDEARQLLSDKNVKLLWVEREQNLAGKCFP